MKQLSAFCQIVHSLCLEKFGEEVKRKKKDGLKQPNLCQVKKGKLRTRQWQLKRQLKDAPQQEKIWIQVLLDDIKQEILVLSRAENHRKRRKSVTPGNPSTGMHMPSLRSSSPQPRLADLTSPYKNLKTISERHFRPPEGSPTTTDGWHPTVRRARNSFHVSSGCMRPRSLFVKPTPAVPQG